MALDLSKFNILKRLDARGRVLFLVGGVFGFIIIVYLIVKIFFGGGGTTGATRVAAPPSVQSVQGGQLSPEYQRALMQANVQNVQQAQMTGGSAINTMINPGQVQGQAGCIICTEQAPNVKNLLDNWVKQGNLTSDLAAQLQQLADSNVPENAYADALDRMVKAGNLTPEQARQLLEQYKKQHAAAMLAQSASLMDAMIKSGQLPLDAANELLAAQKAHMSPSEYAALLQRLVKEGKLSPEAAQRLLTQYTQQRAKEIIAQSQVVLAQMGRQGQLTPDVERALSDLETQMVPVDAFSAQLQTFVSQGKLTPAVADRVLTEYKQQKTSIGPTSTLNQLLEKAQAAAYQEITDLLNAKRISQDVAEQLTALLKANGTYADYQAAIQSLVQQKKLPADVAKLKLSDYKTIKQLQGLAAQLAQLQANNASPTDYADQLKRAVQAGLLTPAQAAELMREYQAATAKGVTPGPVAGGTEAFTQLQQRVAAGAPSLQPKVSTAEFAVAQTQAEAESAQARNDRIQAIMAAMSGQAQQLVNAWAPPIMKHVAGTPESKEKATTEKRGQGGEGGQGGKGESGTLGAGGPPLIKSGSILFAVLDTALNSDYPNSPVLATIVDGKYKGAKLLGKMVLTKNVVGQMDKMALTFTMMNRDDWDKTKTITAYAIDPDTARSVMASSVNYHYMLRFGSIMATSFLQGYATSITNAGTSTTGIFGTSTTHPSLGPGQKIAVGLGQVGQTLGAITQNYVNRPPTVKVDSGVGLGILFMADVT